MASSASSSVHVSISFRCSSASQSERLFVGHPSPTLMLPRHPFSYRSSVLTFSRRRSNTNSAITSSSSSSKKNKKQILSHNDAGKEDDLDEDAFETLFNQLEEDLKNDEQFANEDDDEISEEELAKLERELEEALGDDELLGAFDIIADEKNNNEDEEDDDDEEEERPVKLKNWQLRRLAYALKNGKRKTSIKTLAADLCIDRAVVLQLLRDPPPNLLMMSAALPDKPVSTISEPEIKPIETVSAETITDAVKSKAKVKVPVHVMQGNWSAQKRLKKVQVETLERVYRRTKRPTNTMVSSIVHVTNLPRKKVVKWFEDKRTEDGVPDRRMPYQPQSAPETPKKVRVQYHLRERETMATLQRSSKSFRRQGSSGFVWDDKLLSEVDHRELRNCQSYGGFGMMEQSRSNASSPIYVRCFSAPAMNSPSPKSVGTGIFGGASGKPPIILKLKSGKVH